MRLYRTAKFIPVLILVAQLSACLTRKTAHVINSPDQNISVHFRISEEKQAFYHVEFSGAAILQQSKLGLIRDDGDFSKNLSLESASDIEIIKTEYELLGRIYSYTGNRKIFHLKNSSGQKMDIIFQVSNDGVAFRYYFPGETTETKQIIEETGSFHFLPGTKTWIQLMAEAKSGWCQVNPSYEEHYQQSVEPEKLITNKAGWVLPALFNFDKYWMLITETAPDRNYCGGRLKHDSTSSEFSISFPQPQEIYPGGPLNPQSTLPWYTPWRIIAVGNSLKPIVESTLGTDLAEPSKLQDVSYVKPGKASWSWALLKDGSVVYDVQKRFIDLAASMKWEYCLIDVNWDTQIGYDKIKELAGYARSKNVGLILWYNSSGDWNTTVYHPKSKLLTHENRVKEFSRIKEMGIKGVKVDFFGGDGQSMMAYYQDIFEDAAAFGLVVNCHGATIPRGWQRTYPNLLTMEAVRGFEFVTFDQHNADLEAQHACVLPFTRNAYDPMDFTPMCFSEVPNIKRKTTNGFELALSVIFWSGIQHFAETPAGMAKVPDYVKEFLRGIPSQWDEIRFVDGYPGKLVVIARRFKDTWYVAGINGENIEKSLSLDLPFLENLNSGKLISDGADNRSFNQQTISHTSGKPLDVKLKSNGGFVITIGD